MLERENILNLIALGLASAAIIFAILTIVTISEIVNQSQITELMALYSYAYYGD